MATAEGVGNAFAVTVDVDGADEGIEVEALEDPEPFALSTTPTNSILASLLLELKGAAAEGWRPMDLATATEASKGEIGATMAAEGEARDDATVAVGFIDVVGDDAAASTGGAEEDTRESAAALGADC